MMHINVSFVITSGVQPEMYFSTEQRWRQGSMIHTSERAKPINVLC